MSINPARPKVTLWTRQDIRSLKALEDSGAIRIGKDQLTEKFEEITDYVVRLYSWFVEEASRRLPRPAGVEFPVWCSISEENMLRPVPGQVVYVLEVDPSEVIYFDGQKWDYVLNHHYVAKDKADAAAYAKDLEAKGFSHGFSFFDDKTSHFYPQERQRIIDSWIRVFDIEEWNIFNVQANLWEIRPDMIKTVLYHESDQPKEAHL